MKGSARGGGDETRRSTVTIHDVARAAGVSSMTVSRVINEHRHVSAATREKVLETIAALNFFPNAAASSLRTALRIGMIYSNPTSSNVGLFLMGAFRQSAELGCQLLVEPSSAHPDGLSAVTKLIGMGVDGIILPPPLCDDATVLNTLAKTKIVALSFATGDPRPGDPAVVIDDFAGATRMTEHLVALGHRDIAFIRGDQAHSPAIRREEAFLAAMAEAGLPVRPEWIVDGDFTYRSGLGAAQSLLFAATRPTAIFACNDDMAAAACAVAHGLSMRIPDDISICGFDDSPVATIVWPELTTIRQPIADMAAIAVSVVADHVRRTRTGEAIRVTHRQVEVALIERASTGAAPSRPRGAPGHV